MGPIRFLTPVRTLTDNLNSWEHSRELLLLVIFTLLTFQRQTVYSPQCDLSKLCIPVLHFFVNKEWPVIYKLLSTTSLWNTSIFYTLPNINKDGWIPWMVRDLSSTYLHLWPPFESHLKGWNEVYPLGCSSLCGIFTFFALF